MGKSFKPALKSKEQPVGVQFSKGKGQTTSLLLYTKGSVTNNIHGFFMIETDYNIHITNVPSDPKALGLISQSTIIGQNIPNQTF